MKSSWDWKNTKICWHLLTLICRIDLDILFFSFHAVVVLLLLLSLSPSISWWNDTRSAIGIVHNTYLNNANIYDTSAASYDILRRRKKQQHTNTLMIRMSIFRWKERERANKQFHCKILMLFHWKANIRLWKKFQLWKKFECSELAQYMFVHVI